MGFLDKIAGGSGLVGKGLSALGFGHKTRLREIQSAEEQGYIGNLNRRSTEGTIPVDMLNRVAGRTQAQFGSMNRNRMQGQMMQQGLGNSIVAMELMRKTDRETLSSLADESRKISLSNEMSKVKAQDMLGEYGLMRSNRLMGIAQANAEYKRAEEANRENPLDVMGDIMAMVGGGK